jgi:hypothetical protein
MGCAAIESFCPQPAAGGMITDIPEPNLYKNNNLVKTV